MSDADDIRDQFGERLWKTPDELNRDRSMEVAKGKMMDKEEVNRKIHELRGLCWHEYEDIRISMERPSTCVICGEYDDTCATGPDYFASSTPRGELDDAVAKCVEKVGGPTYYSKLEIEVRASIGERPRNYDIAAASPEAICMAIAACIEESK
jgi:hypothetical protein